MRDIEAAIVLLLAALGAAQPASIYEPAALQAADQCDWSGSGGGGRGVRPVYLRCSRGTVSWRYPRGALRVVLSPPVLSMSGKDNVKARMLSSNEVPRVIGFRACTKVSGPARVYLEMNGKLRPVYSPRDGKHEDAHRCFHAKKQPAAFYIEAEEDGSSINDRRDTRLQYDLELRHVDHRQELRRFNDDEDNDCRPCSMEELAAAYCQSDLVARGTVSAVQRQPSLEAAELVVGITKTLRRVDETDVTETNEVIDFTEPRKSIRVRVPTACDARHGQGEFVIMAKRRLGDLVLVCAPRLETWAKAVRELESAPCVLRS